MVIDAVIKGGKQAHGQGKNVAQFIEERLHDFRLFMPFVNRQPNDKTLKCSKTFC